MEKQILHGIGRHEGRILEIREMIEGVEVWLFGPRGGVVGYIVVDKQEFRAAIADIFTDLVAYKDSE